jgi:hypothetical protein
MAMSFTYTIQIGKEGMPQAHPLKPVIGVIKIDTDTCGVQVLSHQQPDGTDISPDQVDRGNPLWIRGTADPSADDVTARLMMAGQQRNLVPLGAVAVIRAFMRRKRPMLFGHSVNSPLSAVWTFATVA